MCGSWSHCAKDMSCESITGGRWLHEIKFDGYRVQLHIVNEAARVFTRRGLDWTNRFKKIANDAFLINASSATIDDEAVPRLRQMVFPGLVMELPFI